MVEALDHQFKNPERLFPLYSVLNRVRLRCSKEVLTAADSSANRILEQFFRPNLSAEGLRQLVLTRPDDPLKEFSEACRRELHLLERQV